MQKKIFKIHTKLKAITAVESLIYLVLFGIIFMSVMQFVITMRENNQISLAKVNLEKVIIFLNDHFNDSFKNSLSIDETNSTFSNDEGKLRILKTDGFREYTLNNGEFSFSDNGTTKTILDPDYKVQKLVFDKILNSKDQLQGIRIELKVVSIKNSTNQKEIITSFLIK